MSYIYQGLYKNYVAKNVGMKLHVSPRWLRHFFPLNPVELQKLKKRQQSCRLVEFLAFNSAYSRHGYSIVLPMASR